MGDWRVYVQEVNTDDMTIRIQLERLGETGFDEYACASDDFFGMMNDEYEQQQRNQQSFFMRLITEGKEWKGEYTAEGGRSITTNDYDLDDDGELFFHRGRPNQLQVYERDERFTNDQGQEFQNFTIDLSIGLWDRFQAGEDADKERLVADRKEWFEGIFVVTTKWRQLRSSRKDMVREMWKAGDTWDFGDF